MAPLRVEADVPIFDSCPLIFETEKWKGHYDEKYDSYQSKTLEELDEICRQSEEAMWRELVNYAVAYEMSWGKASEATCGTAGRLAGYNRRLRHDRLRLEGKGHSEWKKTKAELVKDLKTLEQIKKEQSEEQSEEPRQQTLAIKIPRIFFKEEQTELTRQQTLAKQIKEISSRLQEVNDKIAWCNCVDRYLLPEIRKEYIHPIITENEQQSVRIPFFGSDRGSFRKGENAIVSFPGVHGQAWEQLTEVSHEAHSPIVTSCIFLPDEKAPGYGQHDPKPDGSCYCIDLYGKQEEWACVWFAKWREQTLRAHSKGCNLLVVTKMDGSVGRSQKGEIRWLDDEELPYKKVSIKDFAEMILPLPTK